MPSGPCGFEIPGWNMILDRHIYLGELENELSWHAADAKSIEVGGHLFGPVDNDIFEAIKECELLKTFGKYCYVQSKTSYIFLILFRL